LYISQNLLAQRKPSNDELTEICNKIEQVIGEDWFVCQTTNGFEVYFCRTCNQNYQKWVKEDRLLDSENHDTPIYLKDRYNFFKPELADSVSYFTRISGYDNRVIDTTKELRMKDYYPNNGILKFIVRIDQQWSTEKVNDVLAQNEILKTEILLTPLYKTNENIFSDYRYYLPDAGFKHRTEKRYDFYFERLPYSSCWLDYSIFIEQNNYYEVMYADMLEDQYFSNPRIFMDDERYRTLKIIALTLGITDFTLIN
jgi:hypothetical protein